MFVVKHKYPTKLFYIDFTRAITRQSIPQFFNIRYTFCYNKHIFVELQPSNINRQWIATTPDLFSSSRNKAWIILKRSWYWSKGSGQWQPIRHGNAQSQKYAHFDIYIRLTKSCISPQTFNHLAQFTPISPVNGVYTCLLIRCPMNNKLMNACLLEFPLKNEIGLLHEEN